MPGDWIKLHRRALESRVFSDPFLWHLWCWCLMKANWKRSWKLGREIPPGSFATGELSAAEQLSISGSKWRRGMQKLREFGMIEIEATNRFTIVFIVKWSEYQSERRTSDEPSTNQRRATDEQPTNHRRTTDEPPTTIEEGKERKKERNYTHSHLANGFEEEWERWCAFRESMDGRVNAIQLDAQLMELNRRGKEKAKQDIDFSIQKGAKSILDSDHDFSKRTISSGARAGKKTLEELGL